MIVHDGYRYKEKDAERLGITTKAEAPTKNKAERPDRRRNKAEAPATDTDE